MPFTFKLSHRLARLWAASLVIPVVALIASCDLRPRTGVDNTVAQVIVSPDTLTLDPLQSYQFHVFGRTQAGDSIPVSVQWTASAGPITSSGMDTPATSVADAPVAAPPAHSKGGGRSSVKKSRLLRVLVRPQTIQLAAGV